MLRVSQAAASALDKKPAMMRFAQSSFENGLKIAVDEAIPGIPKITQHKKARIRALPQSGH
jgi:hypothetical protein